MYRSRCDWVRQESLSGLDQGSIALRGETTRYHPWDTYGEEMKPTKEEIAERLDKDKARRNEKPTDIWRPTITEREAAERAKQVANGELPF